MKSKVIINSNKFRKLQDLMLAVTVAEIIVDDIKGDNEKLINVYKNALVEIENIFNIKFVHTLEL